MPALWSPVGHLEVSYSSQVRQAAGTGRVEKNNLLRGSGYMHPMDDTSSILPGQASGKYPDCLIIHYRIGLLYDLLVSNSILSPHSYRKHYSFQTLSSMSLLEMITPINAKVQLRYSLTNGYTLEQKDSFRILGRMIIIGVIGVLYYILLLVNNG